MALYNQIFYRDLIARDFIEYVSIVTKLLRNETFRFESRKKIGELFNNNIHKNYAVAMEWRELFMRLMKTSI